MYFYACLFLSLVLASAEDTEVVVLRAVRGQSARLPCGQGRLFLDGPDSYVLWLKDDEHFLHRFPDAETNERKLSNAECLVSSDNCEDGTALRIRRVSDEDAGMYRCRVHYQAAPSQDYVFDLRLVDAPDPPKIYNEEGKEIKDGHIGPLSVGANFTLVCVVKNAPVDTLLYWRRNGVARDRAPARADGDEPLRAEVRASNLTRGELGAHYDCLAQNADVTDPLTAGVVVTMQLPPLSVEIRLNNNVDFEAGQPRVVDCIVIGCVPPPVITWHLGSTLLRPNVHKELHDGNYTVSSLTLSPALRSHGQALRCRAHNPLAPHQIYEDSVMIHVGYKPVCVSPRRDTVGAVQPEAETVTCTVEASPEPFQFAWTFPDTRMLYTSVKPVPGHTNRYTSTLSWIPRDEDLGELQCRATNGFGDQKQPCTYAVATGGAPQPPDCVVLRTYPRDLRVQCKKGWDGGRSQSIHLEVLDDNGNAIENMTDITGNFHLQQLDEGKNFTAAVYASNSRGHSRPTTLHLHTLLPITSPAVITEVGESGGSSRWLVAGQACAGVAALALAAGVALCLRLRRRRSDNNPDLVPAADGVFHREPDFTRVNEDRLLGTTNITVNQLASCQNQYSPSTTPCRVHVALAPGPPAPPACSHQAFYV